MRVREGRLRWGLFSWRIVSHWAFGSFLGVLLGDKFQRRTIHTVPQTGRRWTIFKDVSEVGSAATAMDLPAWVEHLVVDFFSHCFII